MNGRPAGAAHLFDAVLLDKESGQASVQDAVASVRPCIFRQGGGTISHLTVRLRKTYLLRGQWGRDRLFSSWVFKDRASARAVTPLLTWPPKPEQLPAFQRESVLQGGANAANQSKEELGDPARHFHWYRCFQGPV